MPSVVRQGRLNSPLRYALGGIAAFAFSGLLAIPQATARASFDSPYSLDQTYSAALRYVRVDMGLKITEKDPQAAYVLFEYKSTETGDRISNGAIEAVTSGQTVKVVVSLAGMPRYHEQVVADGLQKKLRDEYGEPPKKAPPTPPAPPPDAGPDGE